MRLNHSTEVRTFRGNGEDQDASFRSSKILNEASSEAFEQLSTNFVISAFLTSQQNEKHDNSPTNRQQVVRISPACSRGSSRCWFPRDKSTQIKQPRAQTRRPKKDQGEGGSQEYGGE